MSAPRGHSPAVLYRRVQCTAQAPPGGVPEGWTLQDITVEGAYEPDQGEWWHAAAEYGRCEHSTGTRRLIGAGPSVRAALAALEHRLSEPLETRRHHTRGGWDTNQQPGCVVDQP